jgi:hypothetical protein
VYTAIPFGTPEKKRGIRLHELSVQDQEDSNYVAATNEKALLQLFQI